MVIIEDILINYCSFWEKICGLICFMSCVYDMVKWMKFYFSGGLNESGNCIMLLEIFKFIYKVCNFIILFGISKYFLKLKVFYIMSEDNYVLGWRNGYYRGIYLECDVLLFEFLYYVDMVYIFFVCF